MPGGERRTAAAGDRRSPIDLPTLALADEPTGAVDTETSDQLFCPVRTPRPGRGGDVGDRTHARSWPPAPTGWSGSATAGWRATDRPRSRP